MKRFWIILTLLLLAASVLPTLNATGAEQATESAPIDPYILEEMARSPEGTATFLLRFRERADLAPAEEIRDWTLRGQFVYETLKETAERSQAAVRAWLEARGIAYRPLVIDNSLIVTAGRPVLEALAAFPEVARIEGNRIYTVTPFEAGPSPEDAPGPQAIPWNISQIGADLVWNDFGVKGQGVVVAGMTTGAEYTHDALLINYKCGSGPHDDCWYDPAGYCPGYPCDGNGHGTHTLGTVVGDDDPGLTWNAGVAPDAQWIYCRPCSDTGSCSTADLQACANWFLAPNGDPANRPNVILAAWGGAGCNDWFRSDVQAWRAAGILAAFAPGAGGPSCATAGSPGDYPESFSTGATDPSDTVTTFSSRGPSCWGEIKPEVVAPGVEICSAIPGNGWSCGYSGTSMSAAHTAGLAALLFSADPGLIGDPAAVEQIITGTAVCRTDPTCGGAPCPDANNVYGWGRIDAYAAVSQTLPQQPLWTLATPDPLDMTRYDCVWFDDGTGDSWYNQKVYCMGGRISSTAELPDVWRYNPLTDAWVNSGWDIVEDVSNYTANLLRDETGWSIYVVGGYDVETSSYVDHVQRFTPPYGPIEIVTSDPWPGTVGGNPSLPGGCAVAQNKLYCFGGWNSNAAPYFSAETWEYDPLRPAGSRWQRVTTADLSLPRGYIQVAVQNDVIYALGGIYQFIPSPVDLVPTDRVEALDVNNLAAGWQIRANMPLPGGEGRGFGMDVDTRYGYTPDMAPWSGKVYVAGGGDWPDQSAEGMAYDIAGDTWDLTFANLNMARRDHAGAFIPYYTADPTDGMPALWVFGGRMETDNPPFAEPEYYPFDLCNPVTIRAIHTDIGLCQVHFSADLDGSPPIAYLWDWGSGSSTLPDPTVTFTASGTYPFTLTVSNCSGATDQQSGTVSVTCIRSCPIAATMGNTPAQAGRRGAWMTTDLQVINLAPDEQTIAVRFLRPDGQEEYAFSDPLPGGASRYYDPGDNLPPGFTGTVVLAPAIAAMETVHLEPPPEAEGNTTFPGVEESLLDMQAYTPIDRCTRLYLHNLNPGAPANATLHFFDQNGTLVGTMVVPIPPDGLIAVKPVRDLGLPADFVGSVAIEADQPIEVTSRSDCNGLDAYVAPAFCSRDLLLPYIPPSESNLFTTTITIQNASALPTEIVISYSTGLTLAVSLEAWAIQVWDSPFSGAPGWARITSQQPVLAVVRSRSAEQANPGALSYRAIGIEEAANAAALPVLFAGHEGWRTGDHLWVMNVGSAETEVRIRYVTAPTGTVVWDRGVILPGEVWRVQVPDLPGDRAAALLVSPDQPILAVAGATNLGYGEYRDRQIAYAATPFSFDHELVHDPVMTTTVVSWQVTFAGMAQGTPPIDYAWAFGDGTTGTGQVVVHTYSAEGTYTVTMTATNALGYGVAATSGRVTISGPPSYAIYLPIVVKNW